MGFRFGLSVTEIMNLSWREYELRVEALNVEDEQAWLKWRKLITQVHNSTPFMKKGGMIKETDVIRLPIDDMGIDYTEIRMSKERFMELKDKWKA